MSSSFLNPSVTPVTALATRLRARPWNLFSSPSSRSSVATIVSLSCANRIPGGTGWRSVPFGPFTSTAPPSILTLTPLGIGIGFLPIRDIFSYLAFSTWRSLPDVAENFAADARLLGGAAGHHPARGRQDAGAQAAEHVRHIVDAEIDAASG